MSPPFNPATETSGWMSADAPERSVSTRSVSTSPPELLALEREGDTCTVCLRGEIDRVAATRLTPVVDGLDDDVTSVIFDLYETTFIDSSGLRLLLQAKNVTTRRGGTVMIAGAPATFLRVLQLTGCLDQFIIYAR